jgi:hypothetical protein
VGRGGGRAVRCPPPLLLFHTIRYSAKIDANTKREKNGEIELGKEKGGNVEMPTFAIGRI